MSATPFSHLLRASQLNTRQPNRIDLVPDRAAAERIAVELGLSAPPQVRLTATISATSGDAWLLEGQIKARVQQPCVVTLAPVQTDISEAVRRVYSPHLSTPEGEEIEMRDDDIEPLGQSIDVGAVLVEALSLALPPYPRAKGAELPQATVEPDTVDEDTRRPFEGLADLLRRKDN